MNKYETDMNGYVPLKYYKDNKCIESTIYMINVEKVSLINKHTKRILKMHVNHSGYAGVTLHKISHRFHCLIWEHCNGVIPEGLEIDHIDDNKLNNNISNLQLLTHQQNIAKSAKNRDYSFTKKAYDNRHRVKGTDTETGESQVLASLYACQLYYNINCGIVKMCCEKLNNCKSGISKNNNHKIVFEYTNEPLTLINKHYNRFYKPDEAVVKNKEYMKQNQKKYMANYNLDQKMTTTIKQFKADNITSQIQATDNAFSAITKDFLSVF